MKRWRVLVSVTRTEHVGDFEAANLEEAREKAHAAVDGDAFLCWHYAADYEEIGKWQLSAKEIGEDDGFYPYRR